MKDSDYYFFIDETGVASSLDKQSELYILCGCSILNSRRSQLRNLADHIKFKYWNRTDIVLHSAEIANNKGNFSIFENDDKEKQQFVKDIFFLLHYAPVMINAVIVDKNNALSKGWSQKEKIIWETSKELLKNFILMTCAKGKVKGRIIIESSSDKDPYYLKAFNHFLSNGIPNAGITPVDVKKTITSISFVTKDNDDIETQITDLVAYGAKCKYLKEQKGIAYPKNSYEDKIIDLFDKKMFEVNNSTSKEKKKLLKNIDPFLLLPK